MLRVYEELVETVGALNADPPLNIDLTAGPGRLQEGPLGPDMKRILDCTGRAGWTSVIAHGGDNKEYFDARQQGVLRVNCRE